jgi:hypothetical protein
MMPSLSINPDITTVDVLETLLVSGKPLHEGSRAVDGTPMLSAFAGVGKQPANLITAGVYASETVGGQMSLNLLKLLETGQDEATCSTGREDHQSLLRILRP